jgi:neutral ceramidase
MTLGRRRFLRLALRGLLLLWVFGVFVGPWRIEWIEALDGGDAFKLTEIAADRQEPAIGPLRVGAASVSVADLALKHRVPLAGYIGRVGKPNDVLGDDVGVQVVVLDNGKSRLALLTGDLLIISRRLADAVENAVEARSPQLKRQHLYFGATHTHSGPGGYPSRLVERFGIGALNQEFFNGLVERFAQAVVDAEADLQNSEWASFSVESPAECVTNRTRDGGVTNRWIDVMGFRRVGDVRWSASLVTFSAHATCAPSRPPARNELSSDYPGVVRRIVSERLGGTTAFLAGAVGSMAPGRLTQDATQRAEALGKRLADVVVDAARDHQWKREVVLQMKRRTFELPAPRVKVWRGWCMSPIAAAALLPTSATVTAARIGDTIYLGVPADFGGTLALTLRNQIPGARTTATSFAGDYIGYVIEDDDFWLDRYEPRSMVFYGRHLGLSISTILAEFARELGGSGAHPNR